ncbi:MAG: DEAD/DEAH box helicase [Opitutus sp.]|nr:DEAD/DEAH box helicase [Opitutus sp.]MCS6248079.1 DEAD/DEAH box helicase [Opitutus sp.]MCS6274641.1 DEAD/DEAH box helicase [Opitutus sp.]MCS6279089.1 DEAD/DEAH box helicase [Opitutus sp.]MCS6298576.1 DEAD/DEAH box helicase [Opitutus sp.]
MLRLLLPPNLAAAAPRDAIAVKIEIVASAAPNRAEFPALAILKRLCGGVATPPPFVQLTRAQLRELIAALRGQPAFSLVATPTVSILWIGPRLRGVSELLEEAPVAKPDLPVRPPLAVRASSLAAASKAPAPVTLLTVDGSEHFLAITLPSREQSGYATALDLVKTHGFSLDATTRTWWLRDRHKTLNFLATHLVALRDTYHAEFTENFEANTAKLAEIDVQCDITETAGDFTLTLGLQAGKISDDALRTALATNRGYVEEAGKVYLLPPEKIARLTTAQRALAGSANAPAAARRTWRVPAARVAEVQGLIDELVPHYQPPAGWKARSEALRNLSTLTPAPLPDELNALLRPYQQIGVAWLWHLHRHGLGGILADEMGLGKTLQAISLLAALRGAGATPTTTSLQVSSGRPGHSSPNGLPSLVVCPASLVENWRRETARFAPHLSVFVHHGTTRLTTPESATPHDLLITSYGTLARDRELFADIPLACLIADEAQHIKNRRTQNAQALRSLNARSRFLLTGTPVENALDDLRALFDLLMPGYLEKIPAGTRSDERQWFDERLRAKTSPYLLRRTKKAVAPELPDKIEQVLYCEPSPVQSRLYTEWQQKSEQELDALAADGASENSLRLATLTQLLRLRQICCDPRLVAPATSADHSSKLETFRELLAEAVDDGHRLLVFSQFTSLLGLLRAELEEQGLSYCYLDGSTPQKQRQAEVDRYNNSADIPVFLISLKAGGTGLNLTGADTVVHFDPWWNPAVEAQATDRAHRIGQKRVVTSYKLICTGTVEEKVLHMQATKRALLADVFEASDLNNAKLTLTDLKSLLRD